MQGRLARVIVCVIVAGLLLLPSAMFVAGSGEEGSSDCFIPYERLPQDIRVILEECASQPALEFIKEGHPPRKELVEAGLGREQFEGDVYPVYHSEGAVYIFRGSGQITFPDGDTTGVVLSGEDRVAVAEAWPTQTLEAMVGKREPPPDEPAADSSDRIYAGIRTHPENNKYFGVKAYVLFPQFVDTSSPYWCFNVYTTHVVFTDGSWFESLVGQYKWWGGAPNQPTAGFWVSWSFWQFFYKMQPSPGSYKQARITTRYRDFQYAYMWVTDIDQGIQYSRSVSRAGATTRRVTLLQEQVRENPVYVMEAARFQPTYIHLGGPWGTPYSDWNENSGPSYLDVDDPMQLWWIDTFTYEFYTWCGWWGP